MKLQSHEVVTNSVEDQELWPRQCHCSVLGLYNMEASLLGEKNKRSPRSDKGFPGSSDGKESACNVGDPGLISGSGRSPEEGNGNNSSILVWRILWTEEPGKLQSRVAKSPTRLSD